MVQNLKKSEEKNFEKRSPLLNFFKKSYFRKKIIKFDFFQKKKQDNFTLVISGRVKTYTN